MELVQRLVCGVQAVTLRTFTQETVGIIGDSECCLYHNANRWSFYKEIEL